MCCSVLFELCAVLCCFSCVCCSVLFELCVCAVLCCLSCVCVCAVLFELCVLFCVASFFILITIMGSPFT